MQFLGGRAPATAPPPVLQATPSATPPAAPPATPPGGQGKREGENVHAPILNNLLFKVKLPITYMLQSSPVLYVNMCNHTGED